MMMFLNIVLLVAGFVFLVKGADIFVDGSSNVARTFHVPGLVIGLTIVAMGTSFPELAVSSVAAVQGSNEIALSNVIGSNLFNLLMVLGLSALIRRLPVEKSVIMRDFPLFLASTVFVFFFIAAGYLPFGFAGMDMSAKTGTLIRPASIVLIIAFVVYIVYLILDARKNPSEPETEAQIPLWKCALMIVFGAALIILGGQAVVNSAKFIASAMGLTETLIGLTVVAVGTSLPELVTSMVACSKGETGLAVGNAVGSNIFNVMLILGVSCAISPITANVASLWDTLILIGAGLLTWACAATRRSIGRLEGSIMVLCYVGTIVFAIIR